MQYLNLALPFTKPLLQRPKLSLKTDDVLIGVLQNQSFAARSQALRHLGITRCGRGVLHSDIFELFEPCIQVCTITLLHLVMCLLPQHADVGIIILVV